MDSRKTTIPNQFLRYSCVMDCMPTCCPCFDALDVRPVPKIIG